MDLFTKAKTLGIQTEFIDGQGHRRVTDAAALEIHPRRPAAAGHAPAARASRWCCGPACPRTASFQEAAKLPVRWKIVAGGKTIAKGETGEPGIAWPDDLPHGIYRPHLTDAASLIEEVPLIVGAAKGVWRRFRPRLAARRPALWRPLGTQLGHGRFHRSRKPDRARAVDLGADGVGLNPLHALFDDRPGDCSPYSPNSRLFLNPLYIDVEKTSRAFGRAVAESAETTPRLRQSETVDYVAVAGAEMAGAAVCLCRLQGQGKRRAQGGFRKIPRRARRRCCRALPVSRCCGTNSRRRGGNGRRNGGNLTTANAQRCARARMPPRSNSSSSCNGMPTGNWRACSALADPARHEGRALSRCRRRRAIRRL